MLKTFRNTLFFLLVSTHWFSFIFCLISKWSNNTPLWCNNLKTVPTTFSVSVTWPMCFALIVTCTHVYINLFSTLCIFYLHVCIFLMYIYPNIWLYTLSDSDPYSSYDIFPPILILKYINIEELVLFVPQYHNRAKWNRTVVQHWRKNVQRTVPGWKMNFGGNFHFTHLKSKGQRKSASWLKYRTSRLNEPV